MGPSRCSVRSTNTLQSSYAAMFTKGTENYAHIYRQRREYYLCSYSRDSAPQKPHAMGPRAGVHCK